MPTSRNTRGVDLVLFSQSGRRKLTVQVKGLSSRKPAPFGGSKETLIADYVVVFQHVMSANPRAFVMTATDVRRRLHKGVKDGVASYWLQPPSYERFEGKWSTIGKGIRR